VSGIGHRLPDASRAILTITQAGQPPSSSHCNQSCTQASRTFLQQDDHGAFVDFGSFGGLRMSLGLFWAWHFSSPWWAASSTLQAAWQAPMHTFSEKRQCMWLVAVARPALTCRPVVELHSKHTPYCGQRWSLYHRGLTSAYLCARVHHSRVLIQCDDVCTFMRIPLHLAHKHDFAARAQLRHGLYKLSVMTSDVQA
jgi:hypothetical protein